MAKNFFGITDKGKTRDNNEDAFIAQPAMNNKFILAGVIDGVGGYEGGEVAASLAKEAILEMTKRSTGPVQQQMREVFCFANERIYEEKHKSGVNQNMACVLTLALADVENNEFHYAHVGDTRLYLYRDHSLVKVTKDQSFVGFLEDSGRLSEEAAMKHPKRNEINKALGFDPIIDVQKDYIETGSSPFLPGDILLVCSDGLTDMISSHEITAVLESNSSLKKKAEVLIDAANSAGGKDNITVVLVENNKEPLQLEITRPVTVEKKPVAEPVVSSPAEKKTSKRSFTKTSVVLLLLCLALFAMLAWLWYENYYLKPKKELPYRTHTIREQLLQDSLQQGSVHLMLYDSLFGKAIIIGDTVFIKRDSLFIDGLEAVLTSDSSFKGPGLCIQPGSKYILLQNIVFENFGTAVMVQGGNLHLKNVRFLNCGIPVQYDHLFPPGKYITADMGDSTIIYTDSLSK